MAVPMSTEPSADAAGGWAHGGSASTEPATQRTVRVPLRPRTTQPFAEMPVASLSSTLPGRSSSQVKRACAPAGDARAKLAYSSVAWYEFARGPRTPEQLTVARSFFGDARDFAGIPDLRLEGLRRT
jgi:hypothetical protein